jgi:hypothetical protein
MNKIKTMGIVLILCIGSGLLGYYFRDIKKGIIEDDITILKPDTFFRDSIVYIEAEQKIDSIKTKIIYIKDESKKQEEHIKDMSVDSLLNEFYKYSRMEY